jgi:Helicase conserved C-terminal domain
VAERKPDPDQGRASISFARYTPDIYLRSENGEEEFAEEEARAAATVGLLRSGLLKRFESSAFAFCRTLDKLINEHRAFLEALGRGHVVNTRFLRELAASDDSSFDDLLAESNDVTSAGDYDLKALQGAVSADLAKLEQLCEAARRVTPARDPKLAAVVAALERISSDADHEAISEEDARQKRKVIIFSFFADTVGYLREQLAIEIDRNPALAVYRGRVVAVSGSEQVEPEEIGRQRAVSGFAPISTEAITAEDRFDILIATDGLAEGVNLQQCRNIVNYDVPWNPMRLVQRHGRIDRIGSPHARVFLRTIFPAQRLDQLLNLEQRIMQKIAMAAASIGVASPVQGGAVGRQVFTETREEIERLLAEDATLFERGGSGSAGQTGEEYRQTLRRALEQNPQKLPRMPWGIGSGMINGSVQGVFFCASVGDRTYLRFVPTNADWRHSQGESRIVVEIGTCLRLIECEETTPRYLPAAIGDAVFDLWEIAQKDIWSAWMRETDPANLQPKVRPLNQRVAEFIRANRPPDSDGPLVNQALDILEAPWPRREEILLRDWFHDDAVSGIDKARTLVARILDTGLEPFNQPQLLPPIEVGDIELVCWMGLTANNHR